VNPSRGGEPRALVSRVRSVKEQYVGDVNDYRKYALLRQLADGRKIRLGICWMLTAPDDKKDGGKEEYLDRLVPGQRHDTELFESLKKIRKAETARRLKLVERSGLFRGALFFNEYVPTDAELRAAYFKVALRVLRNADLIFYDPDNGLDVQSVPKGKTDAAKYIYRDEISAAYQAGHSILVYQHFRRVKRDVLVESLRTELKQCAIGGQVIPFRSAHTVFFLIVNPKHEATLGATAKVASETWQRVRAKVR
jgi:hypothetical protein